MTPINHNFPKNTEAHNTTGLKVYHLVNRFIPVLQEWVRNQILKPVWDAVPVGEGYGRRENYPVMERTIQFDMKHTIKITIDLPFIADCIEKGRRAGKMPPAAAIQRWIVVKRILPRNNQTLAQMNYAIRRAIGKKGTDPKNYLMNQMQKTSLPMDELMPIIDEWFAGFADYFRERPKQRK